MAFDLSEFVDALKEHMEIPECPHDPINLQLVCDGEGQWTIGAELPANRTAKKKPCKPCGKKKKK